MIKCKHCSFLNEGVDTKCKICGESLSPTESECAELLSTAKFLEKKKNYVEAVEIYRFLANLGVTEGEREYAAILEAGVLVPNSYEEAMKYFYRAAKKNDAYSAYRYSRLAEREHDGAWEFWLLYSAFLKCRDSFMRAAEVYSERGDEESALYYYSLAADAGIKDADVILAERYYGGVGVMKNENIAKWYINKFFIPPIHAIKLAYRLRSTIPEIPPTPIFKTYGKVLSELKAKAKSLGIDTAYFYLAEADSESGTSEALYTLGTLYIEAVGTKRDIEYGMFLLEKAANLGSADAAKYLGDMFLSEKHFPRDMDRVLHYFKRAASLGKSSAYKMLGDMFYEGELVKANLAYAIELYELGAREGDRACREKARELNEQRENHYLTASKIKESNPALAFYHYAMSTAMGYVPSHKGLARCFEYGIGTKIDRRQAFNWYKIAEERGDFDAGCDLGRCYARGIGTPFNFDLAIKHLTPSAKLGNESAKEELVRLYENKKKHMTRALYSTAMRLIYLRKHTEAIRLLELATELGHPKAIYTLGALLEFGLGLPTDRKRAEELYHRAFSLGFHDARQVYKLKILKMGR